MGRRCAWMAPGLFLVDGVRISLRTHRGDGGRPYCRGLHFVVAERFGDIIRNPFRSSYLENRTRRQIERHIALMDHGLFLLMDAVFSLRTRRDEWRRPFCRGVHSVVRVRYGDRNRNPCYGRYLGESRVATNRRRCSLTDHSSLLIVVDGCWPSLVATLGDCE
jgi:hypothetical protein